MLAVAAVLVAFIGAVVTLGVFNGPDRPNPGASLSGSSGHPVPQDPLSGALILPISDVSGIEAHCKGKNACWVWSLVSTRACRGSVVVDFYARKHDSAPAESVSEDVSIRANTPAYVAVPSADFTERYAKVSQYDCSPRHP